VSTFTLTKRYWLTADKGKLVADGDPHAAFLFGSPGDEIPLTEARRFGLAKAKAKAKEAAAE